MPLVRSAATPEAVTVPRPFSADLDALGAAEATARRQAAIALAQCHGGTAEGDAAIQALSRRLSWEEEPGVREALLLALQRIGGTAAAEALAPFLRSEQTALRNLALEALKHLGESAYPAVDALLGDPEPDVRLLAAEVMRGWPASAASPRLARLLGAEPHVNVCGVVLDVAMAVGDATLLPALAACRQRFAGQAFLQFAIDAASAALAPPPPAPDDAPNMTPTQRPKKRKARKG